MHHAGIGPTAVVQALYTQRGRFGAFLDSWRHPERRDKPTDRHLGFISTLLARFPHSPHLPARNVAIMLGRIRQCNTGGQTNFGWFVAVARGKIPPFRIGHLGGNPPIES
jgi:hypothetical protein